VNLVVSFIHPRKAARTLGPFAAVRIDAETLREASSGAILAHHRDHQWEIGGERYFRLDSTSAVKIHFESVSRRAFAPDESSRRYGPYQEFSSVDGIAYVDGRVFAFIDAKVGDWFSYDDGRHWSAMVVSEAGGASGAKAALAALAGLAPLLPGVLGLWQGGRLVRLATAACLREHVQRLAEGRMRQRPERISALTWETHADPRARRAALLREYRSGSRSLPDTYGAVHGNLVRTSRLIDQARETRSVARSLRAAAEKVRGAILTAARSDRLVPGF
jgi:hypothetical protein